MVYAQELGEEKALYERMSTLARNCAAMPQLTHTLCNPVVSPQEKERLILSAVGGEAGKSYDAFVRVVVENHREKLIQNMALAYMKLYRSIHNISVISIISAQPLPNAAYERIRDDITSRTHGEAEIETHIDPSIEGGFILRIDDMRLDASVRGQLDKIKRQLAGRIKRLV